MQCQVLRLQKSACLAGIAGGICDGVQAQVLGALPPLLAGLAACRPPVRRLEPVSRGHAINSWQTDGLGQATWGMAFLRACFGIRQDAPVVEGAGGAGADLQRSRRPQSTCQVLLRLHAGILMRSSQCSCALIAAKQLLQAPDEDHSAAENMQRTTHA